MKNHAKVTLHIIVYVEITLHTNHVSLNML